MLGIGLESGVLVGVEQLRWREGLGVQVQRGAGGGVDHEPPQAGGGHEQPGAVGGDGSEAFDPAAAVVGVDQGADRDVDQDRARVPDPQPLQERAEQQVRHRLRRRLVVAVAALAFSRSRARSLLGRAVNTSARRWLRVR